ncbi:helix-turn-helix transcriptional regulator [Tessaracoccus caeni]|uniref:helix-turn-helix transcriptional regulator n=1 Tax=Tessaracoccus caeni TaxID=3031239 RepID=UPI0023DBFC89|nr:WYL domain-containing protein [Tessaracoccus caeni]MDF1488011.1 WYL domain-containing protein [Tessaracoccus caeni]
MTSQEQLARMLRLVPYLRGRQGVTVNEVAKDFGVSATTVLSDLTVLQFCGLPGGYPDDLFEVDIDAAREEGVIYHFQNADVLSRPLRLRPAEAASLMAALEVVVELAGDDGAAESALDKLREAVGESRPSVVVDVDSGQPGVRAALLSAIEAQQAVVLTYRKPGQRGSAQVDVEPARLRTDGGFGYLDAWSRPRQAWRSYRLDRIERVEALDEAFEARDPGEISWFQDVATAITLVVGPEAEWIAEYYPCRSVQRTEHGLEVTLPVASGSWARALLLRLGPGVRSCSDAELLRATTAEALGALKRYALG